MGRIFITLILVLSLASLAMADQFSASGRGRSEQAAIMNGLDKAINLAVQQILDQETIQNNSEKIATALKGKTRKLARLIKKSDPEFTGAGYDVRVTADVNLKNLEQEIDALGLMQDSMGNPRIMVLYNPNLPQGGEVGQSSRQFEAFFDNSYGAIVEVLSDKGFDVIDKTSAQQFAIQVADTHELDLDTNRAAMYGLRQNADLVLYYQTVGVGRQSYWQFSGGAARMFLRAQLINPTTSRIIASKDVEATATASTLQEALYRSAKDAGHKISNVMIESIKKSWKREKAGAGNHIVVLDGLPDLNSLLLFKERLKMAPGMENLREREAGGGLATLEIRTASNADAVKSAVYNTSLQMGWNLKLIRSEGNRSSWKLE